MKVETFLQPATVAEDRRVAQVWRHAQHGWSVRYVDTAIYDLSLPSYAQARVAALAWVEEGKVHPRAEWPGHERPRGVAARR